MSVTFFYTVYFPNQWTGTPELWVFDPLKMWEPIASLERAEELAKHFKNDSHGADRCLTTYGIMCEV